MPFGQFSKRQLVLTFDTAELVKLGSVTPDYDLELAHVLLEVFRFGTAAGTERLRLKLYSTAAYEGTPIASDWIAVADVADFASKNFWRLRFDFARQPLRDSQVYYAAIETSGYTRGAGDSYYLGARLDHPFPVNTQTGSIPAAYMALVGYH